MRACLIVNPGALSADQAAALRRLLVPQSAVTMREGHTSADLTRLAAEAMRDGFDRLVVAGNDATIQAVASGITTASNQTQPAVLPLGDNSLARALAIPANPVEALCLLERGSIQDLDLLHVETPAGRRVVLGAASAGFGPRATTGWQAALSALADLHSYRLEIQCDGDPVEHLEALAITITTQARSDPENGCLNVAIIPAGSWLNLAHVATQCLAGSGPSPPHLLQRRARHVRIASEPSMTLRVDNQPVGQTPLIVAAVPQPLRVIAGSAYRSDSAALAASQSPRRHSLRHYGLFALVVAVLLVRRLTWLYVLALIVAALALLGFAHLTDDVLEGEVRPANVAVLQYLHAHASHRLDWAALVFTHLGDVGGTTAIAILAFVVLWRQRRYLSAGTLVVVLLGGLVLVVVLKHVFRQPRPNLFASLAPESGYGYPSGHSLMSVCLYGYLAALVVGRGPRQLWRWTVAGLFVLIALGIIWSRLYLGVHWLSDVVAGTLVALFWLLCCLATRHLLRARSRTD